VWTTASSVRGVWVHNNTVEFWDGTLRFASSALTSGWHHVAVSRISNVQTLYLDGVAQGTFSNGTSWQIDHIGTDPGGDHFAGYIDEFRMTDTVGRYTANFTPPTNPFPNS